MSDQSPLLELANSGADLGEVFSNMKESARTPLDYTEMQLPEEPIEEPSSTVAAPVPQEESTIIERNYVSEDGSGPKPENETVPLERAARGLGEIRRAEFEAKAAAREAEFAEEIDKLRSPEVAEAATPEAQQVEEPQPQQPQWTGVDPEVQRVLEENPKLMAAVQQQRAADWQGALAAREYYDAATAQNANIAIFALFARHPDLKNLTREQLPVALNMMAQSDPVKYAEVRAEIESVKGLQEMAVRAQQMQQHQAAARFQAWSQAQDDAFEAEFAKETPSRQTQLRTEARAMLRDSGLSEQEIEHSWQTNPLLRSKAGQMILMRAARDRLQERTAQTIRPTHAVTKVQRPGSPVLRASDAESADRANFTRLDELTGNAAAKLGAELIAQRRARARR